MGLSFAIWSILLRVETNCATTHLGTDCGKPQGVVLVKQKKISVNRESDQIHLWILQGKVLILLRSKLKFFVKINTV